MVDEALSRADAAQKAGLTDHGLYQALRKPSVLAYRNERLRVLRTSEAARTIKRIADLAGSAKSEAVRLDANQFIAATDPTDPIVPTTKSESTINHKGLGPGLVIQIAAIGTDRQIGSQPVEAGKAIEINDMDEHVPHPVLRKQLEQPDFAGLSGRAREAGEGEKSGARVSSPSIPAIVSQKHSRPNFSEMQKRRTELLADAKARGLGALERRLEREERRRQAQRDARAAKRAERLAAEAAEFFEEEDA